MEMVIGRCFRETLAPERSTLSRPGPGTVRPPPLGRHAGRTRSSPPAGLLGTLWSRSDRPDVSCPACRSRHQCLHPRGTNACTPILLGVILDAIVSQARCQQFMTMSAYAICSCISINGDQAELALPLQEIVEPLQDLLFALQKASKAALASSTLQASTFAFVGDLSEVDTAAFFFARSCRWHWPATALDGVDTIAHSLISGTHPLIFFDRPPSTAPGRASRWPDPHPGTAPGRALP
mmetsp:Transcript_101626/g.163863  ORF Transcript_101626/g.163863 Transcript_101626/m.163863 type:complete len:237 (-) Transcript_101626:162-872(-)